MRVLPEAPASGDNAMKTLFHIVCFVDVLACYSFGAACMWFTISKRGIFEERVTAFLFGVISFLILFFVVIPLL